MTTVREQVRTAGLRPVAGFAGAAGRPAVFLDRDGTLIEPVPYLSDPAQVHLLPGSALAIRRLRRNGFACVVVTNQSGIGRGLIRADQLQAVHAEMCRQLAAGGAELDAIYYCPSMPSSTGPVLIDDHDRKPGPEMLLRAAADLQLDVSASWMIGDRISDVLAGRHAGCRGCILLDPANPASENPTSDTRPYIVATDISVAAEILLASPAINGRTAPRARPVTPRPI